MLVDSWLTSSVEARESAVTSRQCGVHGAFLDLLGFNWCSYRLQTVVSGNLWSCLKEFKPLVVYDVEGRMELETMQRNRASS